MSKNTKIHVIICGLLLILGCSQNDAVEDRSISDVQSTAFDSLLAVKVGADTYGMRNYVLAFLKAGPRRDQDSLEAAKIQRAHLDNIQRMAEEGKLILAGPFLDDGEVRGIYIFAVGTLEEAQKLTASDPAVQAGRLIMELHPWYGSAGLMMVNEIHHKIMREAI